MDGLGGGRRSPVLPSKYATSWMPAPLGSRGIDVMSRIRRPAATRGSASVTGEGRREGGSDGLTVVALVREALGDVLVVVDAGHCALVDARLDRLLERPDVPDVRCGLLVRGRARPVGLVQLVVQQKVLLVGGVEDPALVRVWRAGSAYVVEESGRLTGCPGIGGVADDVGVLLVGDVVDREGVLARSDSCRHDGCGCERSTSLYP